MTAVTVVTVRRTTPANTVTAVTTDTNNPPMFTPEETLAFLENNGIIDLRDVEDNMRKARKEKILKEHPYKIYQGKDGRWRTYLPDDSKSEGRRLIVKTKLEELETLLCQHYESIRADKFKDVCTLENLYPAWIEYKSVHVCETTVIRIKKDWRKYYENAAIVKKPIRKITKLEIDTWVHKMIREHEMNAHKYGNFSVILRQMLEFAVDSEIIEKNLFLDVRINRRRVLVPEVKKPDHTQVFTKSEENMLIERAWKAFNKRENYKQWYVPLAVIFLFYTGLRIGEISALKFEDIAGNSMLVNRLVRFPTGEIVDHTKGTYGSRTVPLIPQAAEIIDLIRTHRQEKGLDIDGFIFCPNEKPVSTYNAIERALKKYCRDLGIEERSPHKERKTFTSALISNGVSINTARQLAGHVDERTTLNNYCYDRSEDDEKLAQITYALTS